MVIDNKSKEYYINLYQKHFHFDISNTFIINSFFKSDNEYLEEYNYLIKYLEYGGEFEFLNISSNKKINLFNYYLDRCNFKCLLSILCHNMDKLHIINFNFFEKYHYFHYYHYNNSFIKFNQFIIKNNCYSNNLFIENLKKSKLIFYFLKEKLISNKILTIKNKNLNHNSFIKKIKLA